MKSVEKIMQQVYKVDEFLLRKFQSISDLCQRSFGLNNFLIAKSFMVIYFMARFIAFKGSIALIGFTFWSSINLLVSVVLLKFFWNSITLTELSFKENANLENRGELAFKETRIICMFVCPFLAITAGILFFKAIFFQNLNLHDDLIIYKIMNIFGNTLGVTTLSLAFYFSSCKPVHLEQPKTISR